MPFFFAAQPSASPFDTLLLGVCCDNEDTVELEEDDDDDEDATEEDEFVRWMLFRGMKSLDTSSELIGVDPEAPPLLAVHPSLRD